MFRAVYSVANDSPVVCLTLWGMPQGCLSEDRVFAEPYCNETAFPAGGRWGTGLVTESVQT